MWHLMATVTSATMARVEWSALCTCGKWKSNEGLDKIANGPVTTCTFYSNQVTNGTFPSIAEDQIIWQSVFEISIAKVYKGPFILPSPLWQMPPWIRVSYATVILSGIRSLCSGHCLDFVITSGRLRASNTKHAPLGDFWRPLFFESLSIGKLKSGCLQKSPPWVKWWGRFFFKMASKIQ